MTFTIRRNGATFDSTEYTSIDEARAALEAAGVVILRTQTENEAGVDLVGKKMGTVSTYSIARSAAAPAAVSQPAGFVPATAKQIALIRKLSARVGGGSIGYRADHVTALSKQGASRLIEEMLTEINA